MNKPDKLKDILIGMDSIVLAYSGGVDSSFLLKVASQAMKDKVLAVTAVSVTYTKEELEFTKKFSKKLGVKQILIKTEEFKNKKFLKNNTDRCYFCKKELFSDLKKIAKIKGYKCVVDASTLSDNHDFRPGSIAKRELGVRSPLQEAGFTKEDIRQESRRMGLGTWDKPSLACLASRLPYGTKITMQALSRIEKAESFLKKIGFSQVRVRHYNQLCRIEVYKNEIPKLLNRRDMIVENLKKIGYNYITVDLEGFRSGSMNITKLWSKK